MFLNILVAVDGSPTADRALEAAGELAVALNSKLTIISVAPEVPAYASRGGIDVRELAGEAEAETKKILTDAVEALPDGLPATIVLKHGNAGEAIVEQVSEGGHDLLVTGSRGRGRLAANLFGSVAVHVHYHCRVATLVIQPEEIDEPGA